MKKYSLTKRLATIAVTGAVLFASFTVPALLKETKAADYTMQEINNEWKHISNDIVDNNYTGMDENQYGWWHFTNGNLDWNYTGMAENQYGWWYFNDGRIDWNYTGMAENQYGWWRFANGRIDWNYTGMAENEYGWWYFKAGRLDWNYTGVGVCTYGKFLFKNGTILYDYNGTTEYNDSIYEVKNGRLNDEPMYVGTGEEVYMSLNIYTNGKFSTSELRPGYDGKIFDAVEVFRSTTNFPPEATVEITGDRFMVKKADAHDLGVGVPAIEANVYITIY